jgi:hypothetical protein
MLTRNLLVSVALAVGTIGVAMTPRPSAAAVDVWVNIGPPPERVEIIPDPRPGWVWTPGYWDWRGNRHVWHKGVWVRERPGYTFQPHRWVEHDGRWYLERGRWDHRRD